MAPDSAPDTTVPDELGGGSWKSDAPVSGSFAVIVTQQSLVIPLVLYLRDVNVCTS